MGYSKFILAQDLFKRNIDFLTFQNRLPKAICIDGQSTNLLAFHRRVPILRESLQRLLVLS